MMKKCRYPEFPILVICPAPAPCHRSRCQIILRNRRRRNYHQLRHHHHRNHHAEHYQYHQWCHHFLWSKNHSWICQGFKWRPSKSYFTPQFLLVYRHIMHKNIPRLTLALPPSLFISLRRSGPNNLLPFCPPLPSIAYDGGANILGCKSFSASSFMLQCHSSRRNLTWTRKSIQPNLMLVLFRMLTKLYFFWKKSIQLNLRFLFKAIFL